jgi:hypothetical protein
VVSIDLGRQLLVDDSLVDAGETTMTRAFHQPVEHPCKPIFFPPSAEELDPAGPACAIANFGLPKLTDVSGMLHISLRHNGLWTMVLCCA